MKFNLYSLNCISVIGGWRPRKSINRWGGHCPVISVLARWCKCVHTDNSEVKSHKFPAQLGRKTMDKSCQVMATFILKTTI